MSFLGQLIQSELSVYPKGQQKKLAIAMTKSHLNDSIAYVNMLEVDKVF